MGRLEKVQKIIKSQGLDALFITRNVNIRYITNYAGDDAFLLVPVSGNAYFMTDFRYFEQAEKECCENITVICTNGADNTPYHILAKKAQELSLTKIGFEEEYQTYFTYRKMQNLAVDVEFMPKTGLVENFRMVKDDFELDCLRKAAAIADQAFTALISSLKPGISEKQVDALLAYELTIRGSEGLAFPNIVASGKNGSLPHAIPSLKLLEKGDFITFDFGAVYNGYRSDITRTVVLGSADKKQKEIYKIVLEAQQTARSAIKSGLGCREADKIARNIIVQNGYGEYFGHSLGHSIGLDIHEKPNLSPVSEDILQAGNVVTVEPGIYIPGWGGVRIEDSVIVKEGGNEIITNFPKDLMII